MRAVRGLRREISGKLAAAGAGSSLVRALSLGDRAGLSSEVREAFRRLGVSHLLAVSGLHLGLVAALAYGAIRMTILRATQLAAAFDVRRFALAGAIGAALVYGLLTGWAPPVQRASVFVISIGLAWMLRRRISHLQLLGLAGGVLLLHEPAALFSASAQLSFAASAAPMALPSSVRGS